jgi:transcriptional regulator with XRE-family HTH domain
MLIQKLRLQRGWSQEQLAELSGLSVRTVQRIERGQTASMESLKALASVFEIDFSQLKEPDMETPFRPAPFGPDPRGPEVSNEEALALAHVRNIKAFYMHVIQYVFVIGFLGVTNLITTPHYPWVIWPALGWGLALAGRGLKAYDRVPFLNADWERREVEKALGRRL